MIILSWNTFFMSLSVAQCMPDFPCNFVLPKTWMSNPVSIWFNDKCEFDIQFQGFGVYVSRLVSVWCAGSVECETFQLFGRLHEDRWYSRYQIQQMWCFPLLIFLLLYMIVIVVFISRKLLCWLIIKLHIIFRAAKQICGLVYVLHVCCEWLFDTYMSSLFRLG